MLYTFTLVAFLVYNDLLIFIFAYTDAYLTVDLIQDPNMSDL